MRTWWEEKKSPKGLYYIIRWEKPTGGTPGYFTPNPRITSIAEADARVAEFKLTLPEKQRVMKVGPQPYQAETIAGIADRWCIANANKSYRNQVVEAITTICAETKWTYADDITAKGILDWKTKRNNVGTTRRLSYLGLVLRWSVRKLDQRITEKILEELKAPQSQESSFELMTPDQARATIAKAAEMNQLPLAHCLSTYAWRAITASKLNVGDVDVVNHTITLQVKGSKKPFVHPLFQETFDLLLPLVKDRDPGDPLFLNFDNKRWYYTESAEQMTGWYRNHIHPLAPGLGGTNAWKRLAFNRMEMGASPWPRPLTIAEMQLFSGHKTKVQVLRYLRTNLYSARALTECANSVQIPRDDSRTLAKPVSNVLQFPGLMGTG